MMVLKRVSMKKTNTGYSIHVFVGDGEVARALREGIDRFFVKLEAQRDPERQRKLECEADKQVLAIKEAKYVS